MSKYLHPFGTNNLTNLDSLRTPPAPVLGTGARWGSHIELTIPTQPSFDNSWVALSRSGATTRWLACGEDGSTLHVQRPRAEETYTVTSGAIVLCTPIGTSWRVHIPRTGSGEGMVV
jgi:hypothetical protein